jgi:hypothetical protein
MTFHVGQKVVCVDDSWQKTGSAGGALPGSAPVKGAVYTVASTPAPEYIALEEVTPGYGWNEDAFRPAVQPREELPECLTELLNVPGRVDA